MAVDEVRFAPETAKMTWSGVPEPEVIAIGARRRRCDVTVRPGGRLSSEPQPVHHGEAPTGTLADIGCTPAVSANKIASPRLSIVAVSSG